MAEASEAAPAPKASYSTDPALYIYTSLTAGSSHIVTATSRLETILRANRVPFKAIDLATDEKARMLWGRRAGKDESGRLRKLPGLVQMGLVLGDLVEIEEWNEYGELKQHVTIYYDEFTQPPKGAQMPNLMRGAARPGIAAPANTPASTASPSPTPAPMSAPAAPPMPDNNKKENVKPGMTSSSVAEEAAAKAKQLRLQSLREKVHGKKDKDEGEKKPIQEAASKSTSTSSENSSTAAATESMASLNISAGPQSPTTGAWKSSEEDRLRQALQSPTSGTWKAGYVSGNSVRSLHGSLVKNASAEEIAEVEEAEAIPEEVEEDEAKQ